MSLIHCQALVKKQRLTEEEKFLKMNKNETIWRT